jgi:hypothetical protein
MRRVLVFIPVALFAATLLMPAQAQAATCYDTGCTGKDPQTLGCSSDARTLDSFTLDSGAFYVELRLSQNCWAAWTRITASTRCTCATSFGEVQGFTNTTIKTATYDYGVQAVAGKGVWTRMISFSYFDRACYSDAWFTGSPKACTVRH